MLSTLLLGLLIGAKHAFESDHLAAVASLTTRANGLPQALRLGAAWGLGHTLTLLLAGAAVLTLDSVMPEQMADALESAVGVMLILLGADVVRRTWRDCVHYHTHQHGETAHFHAHSHRAEMDHARSAHRHEHLAGFPLRALLIGCVHGMAGTAALVLLTLQTIHSFWTGILYIVLFGLGSMIGMAALSGIIALPLRLTANRLTWAHNGLALAVGLFTVGLGVELLWDIGGRYGFFA